MALYQFHTGVIMRLALASRFQASDLFLPIGGYCLGLLFGAAAIDLLASRAVPSGSVVSVRRERADFRLFSLLLLPAYAVAARLFFFDDWLSTAARCATQFGTGLLIAGAHWTFFTLVPRRWAAASCCAAMGAGLALSEANWQILLPGPAWDAAGQTIVPYHRVAIFATLIFALAVVPGMAAALRRQPEPPPAASPDAGRWRTSAALLLLVALLFLLHGLLNAAFLPFFVATRVPENIGLLVILTAAAYAVAGWLFNRDFAGGFRLVVAACAIVHLTLPAFSLFKANVTGLRAVHALAGPLQTLLIASAVIALARTAPRRWLALALVAPHVVRLVEVSCIPILLRGVPGESEALPLAAVLAAAAFFALGRRIDISAYAADASPAGSPPDTEASGAAGEAAGAGDRDSAARLRRIVGKIGAAYGFSGRESEVAELLASGMGADAIGARLGLSANTVNTYVRRIVIKTGSAGRRDFVAMVTGTLDAET